MKKNLTPNEIRIMRNKESEESFEKYVLGPLRFIGWVVFWIIVYFCLFE